MKIENIRIVGASLAYVELTVDGVSCDARRANGVAVVRATAHSSPIVLRGDEVPVEILSAIDEAERRARAEGVTEAELASPRGITVRQERTPVAPDFLSKD